MASIEPVVPQLSASRHDPRYRLMLEGISGFAIFMIDAEGNIATWPAGAQQLYGYADFEAIGRPCALLHPTPDEPIDAAPGDDELTRARTAGNCLEERWQVRKDGSQFWGEGTVTALTNGQGQLEGFVKVLRDATVQKLNLEALQQAKVAAELANAHLVSSVSHELRTPLTPILIWTQILGAEEAPEPGLLKEGLEVIRQCTEEQHALIERFVESARSKSESSPGGSPTASDSESTSARSS